MNRYEELITLARDIKPKHIIEIGTWTGQRAAQLMGVTNAFYTGFDLFEEGTKEIDKQEMNVKQHTQMLDVAKQIEVAGFSKFALIRGNTKNTLPKYFAEEAHPFDFAFIDGGHSEETIRSDFQHIYENIDDGGTIVMDDYYEPPIEGFGCNCIAEEMEGTKLLKCSDPTSQKSRVRLLVVTK